MRHGNTLILAFAFFIAIACLLSRVETQFAFASVSLGAVQRIIPHASNANVVALVQAINKNIGKYADMRSAVNQFFSQKKFGTASPKTLSLYDNSTYSQAKLISLVNNRQAVTQWWAAMSPNMTKLYNAATTTKYKNLYAYFDSIYKNSYDYVIVYWMMCLLMKEEGDDKADKLADLIGDTMDAQIDKTPALAFVIYTDAFEKNHNQTYMKGKW